LATTREIRPVNAAETRPLRQSVLRPREAIAALTWPHDDAPDTGHFGAFVDGEMVATATIHREAQPGVDDQRGWRLRGMATAPAARGQGHGGALVEACIAHAVARGASRVWCNARTGALRFYLAHGFLVEGEPFELPEIGPHARMVRLV
jgi:GNAT superfamily N-acetyltransferase